eukprot:14833944-Alexandrium_andersonii.AAC.1
MHTASPEAHTMHIPMLALPSHQGRHELHAHTDVASRRAKLRTESDRDITHRIQKEREGRRH